MANSDQEISRPSPGVVVTSFFSTPEGKSAVRRLLLAESADALPVDTVHFGTFRKGDREELHVTPAKFLVLTSAGSYSIEVSDGTVVELGPGALGYFEDTTGEGHSNLATSNGAVILMKLPDDFEIEDWIVS